MPTCDTCFRMFKTRGTLAKHQRFYHEGKRVSDLLPAKFTLTFFINQVRQTLSCPVCKYKRDRCRDVRAIGNHFTKAHPAFKLFISYHCQWCNGYIDPAEIEVHAHAHAQNLAFGKPFSPPHPSITPEDGSLSFVHDCGHFVDDCPGCDGTNLPAIHPESSPASISIDLQDGDVDNLVNCDPPSSSPSAVVVPPSYRDILLRSSSPIPDTFPSDMVVPSPPSPVLFDPSSQSSPCVSLSNPTQSPSTPPAVALLDPSLPGDADQCVVESHEMSTLSTTYSAPYPSVPDSPELMKPVLASSPAVSVGPQLDPEPQLCAPPKLAAGPSSPAPPMLCDPSVSPPASVLSMSPHDSPSQRQLLFGFSSPSNDESAKPPTSPQR